MAYKTKEDIEIFVDFWNRAYNMREVSHRYGMTHDQLMNRGKYLRHCGYKLKLFQGGSTSPAGKRLTPMEFVHIWQTSRSIGEVMKRTGMPIGWAYQRSSGYRMNGVPLQYFKLPRKYHGLRAKFLKNNRKKKS